PIDLIERLTDIHTTALQLDVHHRQAVDQHRDVVPISPGALVLLNTGAVLVDHLQTVVVYVRLVDEPDILRRPIVAGEELAGVLLEADGLLHDAVVRSSDPLAEELRPLAI